MSKSFVRKLEITKEYFIFLLPVFFVLHEFNKFLGIISYTDVIILTGKYLLITALVLIVSYYLFLSVRKASFYSFIIMSCYFFWGSFHDWLKQHFEGFLITRYSFLLPSLFIVLLLLFFYLKRKAGRFNLLAKYLNCLLLVLLFLELFDLILTRPVGKETISKATSLNPMNSSELKSCDTCARNDIYLIVLDGYAGKSELTEVLRFDNSPFLDSLERKGFHIVESSKSNYNYSELSIGSMFSLGYLLDVQNKSGNELSYIGRTIVNNSFFVNYLKKQNYEIKNYSIFDIDDQEPLFKKGYFNDWEQLITAQTLPERIKDDLGFHLFATVKLTSKVQKVKQQIRDAAYEDIHKIDEVIKQVSLAAERPRFFYVHLLMPHDPYYFDKEGRLMDDLNYLSKHNPNERKAYVDYLQFTNQKVLYLVNGIIKGAQNPPIIMLMSDHGFRHSSVEIPYHFATLNAVLFPDGRYDGFYPGMSNVNQLRVLLNNKFNQQLPLLADSTIYLPWTGN